MTVLFTRFGEWFDSTLNGGLLISNFGLPDLPMGLSKLSGDFFTRLYSFSLTWYSLKPTSFKLIRLSSLKILRTGCKKERDLSLPSVAFPIRLIPVSPVTRLARNNPYLAGATAMFFVFAAST